MPGAGMWGLVAQFPAPLRALPGRRDKAGLGGVSRQGDETAPTALHRLCDEVGLFMSQGPSVVEGP